MSLSRWSHSAHYIYQTDKDTLQVSGFGQFSSNEIMEGYDQIEKKAKDRGYSLLNRLELRFYLRTWAKLKLNFLSYENAMLVFNGLRHYGEIKRYLRDPWSYTHMGYGTMPEVLQIHKCFSKAIPQDLWDRHQVRMALIKQRKIDQAE